ncbi:MAG TPA: cytochrome c family protein [Rhizomicrobium sp.]|nr:cytochrome c family protein [Rhizomicrobium sp.]
MVRILKSMGIAGAALMLISQAQAADAKHGASVFARCAICHSDTKGAPAKIGPNLFDVVGRKAGSEANFSYSAAMKGSGITWTPDKLTAYVEHPQQVVPGNRMAFAGITSTTDAQDLVAYLETLK